MCVYTGIAFNISWCVSVVEQMHMVRIRMLRILVLGFRSRHFSFCCPNQCHQNVYFFKNSQIKNEGIRVNYTVLKACMFRLEPMLKNYKFIISLFRFLKQIITGAIKFNLLGFCFSCGKLNQNRGQQKIKKCTF